MRTVCCAEAGALNADAASAPAIAKAAMRVHVRPKSICMLVIVASPVRIGRILRL
jgi:hypothetical protein